MKLSVVNFANDEYRLQQRWNSFTAKYFGKADRVISYEPKDIQHYLDEYPSFKQYKKGFGNYFWKPYVIQQALDKVNMDEFLFYSDSGALVLKDLKLLARYLDSSQKEIMAFKLPLIERQWTKRDAFILLENDNCDCTDTPQCLATFILFKKTPATIAFVEQYRIACLDERIVSDMKNQLGRDNYPGFVDHRHDQSVFSILAKQSPIVQIEGDLSDCGFFIRQYRKGDEWLQDAFSTNLNNYRFRNFVISNRKVHPLKYLIKFCAKRLLFSLGLYDR